MNVKVFKLMSEVSQTKFFVQDEPCDSKCGLSECVYNSKQKWNYDECLCKCNKECKIDEYLEIKTCLWKKVPL